MEKSNTEKIIKVGKKYKTQSTTLIITAITLSTKYGFTLDDIVQHMEKNYTGQCLTEFLEEQTLQNHIDIYFRKLVYNKKTEKEYNKKNQNI